jgi:hypothetical protein
MSRGIRGLVKHGPAVIMSRMPARCDPGNRKLGMWALLPCHADSGSGQLARGTGEDRVRIGKEG